MPLCQVVPIVKFLTSMSFSVWRKKINFKIKARILENTLRKKVTLILFKNIIGKSTCLHKPRGNYTSNYMMSHVHIFLQIKVFTINYGEKLCKWLTETNFSSGVLKWISIYGILKYFVICKWRFLRQAFAPFISNSK